MGIADKTPMASPDHWQAMQITDAAVFYSRLSKWDEHFDGLPVHRIQKQIWYPLGLQTLNHPAGGGALRFGYLRDACDQDSGDPSV
ncbi:MAG: hypothetical protein U0996_19145 [Planctomycetaceae bacterium]